MGICSATGYNGVLMTKLDIAVEQQVRKQADIARLTLADYVVRAAQIVQELAAAGDSDRIRLQAALAILDRSGVIVGPIEEARDESEQSEFVKQEAERTIAHIRRNREVKSTLPATPEVGTLMVLEDEGDVEPEVLAIASAPDMTDTNV